MEHKAEILKKLVEVKAITQLETMEDSIKLGQLFIEYKLLLPLERHLHSPDEKKLKYPKHLIPARP